MVCDHLVGWKIIEDGSEFGEELYFPVFESDEEDDIDEEFTFCAYCGEEL